MKGDNNGVVDLMEQMEGLPGNQRIEEIPREELIRRGMFWALAPPRDPNDDDDED